MRKQITKQKTKADEREGEDGFELSAEDEAALDRAWARERTPDFLVRITRQAAEYDEKLAALSKEAQSEIIESLK